MPTRRVVLVADLDQTWAEIVRTLEADHLEVDLLAARTPAATVVACAARADAVVIIDLAADAADAMATLTQCRLAVPRLPVIVVAASPSVELTRSIRMSGAFYLALHPVSGDEMRNILASAFDALEAQRASAISCRSRRRILVIDDDADFRASTATLLESFGYDVTTAANGREGMATLQTHPADLVVLDVMMEHDNSGYEVNQAIKYGRAFDALHHVPIVMVSSIDVDPATRFQTAGEVDMITPNVYLTKPLDIPRFIAEVRSLLGERVAEGELVCR